MRAPFLNLNLRYLTVFVFMAFISKSVNNQCYNKYLFGKISKRSTKNVSLRKRKNSKIYSRQFQVKNETFFQSGIVCYKFSNSSFFCRDVFCRYFRDLSGNVFVVALIVDRFRDKRHKHEYGKIFLI